VLVLAGVVIIALGLDTGFLTRLSLASTSGIEQMLVEKSDLGHATRSVAVAGSNLPLEGTLPPLTGATLWLNSPPLTPAQLRGKVVLVDFWTYSCINCLRALPYVNAWAAKYKDHGLVVIGVHSPEFAFEKDGDNVRRAVKDQGITYPVAMDNDLKIWQAFNNEYWPADYLIDGQARIRSHAFGEGDYGKSEHVIQQLLAEAGFKNVPGGIVNPQGSGAQAAPDMNDIQSPETYIGYAKAEHFRGLAYENEPHLYTPQAAYDRNQWGLAGSWTIGDEKAVLDRAPGKIIFRFHARDLHLVLGPGPAPVRFRVSLDGAPPGAAHGADTDADGNGTVMEQRLYQLVRQQGPVADHTFTIEFLGPGVQAFSFTFG
jgi:thiol-disulfide isomerase/thioredoxin